MTSLKPLFNRVDALVLAEAWADPDDNAALWALKPKSVPKAKRGDV
jgi:hypothetical protein